MEPDHISDDLPEWARIIYGCGVSERTHDLGDRLTTRGEVSSGFFIVIEGTVEIFGEDGAVIATVGRHGLVGELGLLTRLPRSHTAVAKTRVRTWHGDLTCFTTALDHDVVRTHLGHAAARRLAEAVKPVVVPGIGDVDTIVRPLLPADRSAYLEALDGASAETLRTRFFTPARPAPVVVEQLLNIDFVNQFAWVAATTNEPDVGLGIGRFVAVPDAVGHIELAVTVEPKARGLGLGSLLVGAVAVAASSIGYKHMEALVLAENKPMRAILDKCGASWEPFDAGVVRTLLANDAVATRLVGDHIAAFGSATQNLALAASLALI